MSDPDSQAKQASQISAASSNPYGIWDLDISREKRGVGFGIHEGRDVEGVCMPMNGY